MKPDNPSTDSGGASSRRPFFYDVTLRDGNQALRKPWNLEEKERVFNQLLKLGVQGIEVGFSGASDMDFAACEHLARKAPENVVVSGLARAVERDITKVWEAVQYAPKPRIHTFIATSPFNMENVLRMSPAQVQKKAVEAVSTCAKIMTKGDIQFSAEHFGDSRDNLAFVIETFQAVVEAGASVINLPNTVERYRPMFFVEMVSKVVEALPAHVTVAVHNHNDLGMATATTVESFFAGAIQLETALNGLGERAGNTNMYEVACALHNCGVDVPLRMNEIYESALLLSEWAQVPIYEKAPLVGDDVIAHRSGIHQDGASKTKGMKKGAYRAIEAGLIGREEEDRLCFTSQSGKTAVYEILHAAGLPVSLEESAELQPILKRASEQGGRGELTPEEIQALYDRHILHVEGPIEFRHITARSDRKEFTFELRFQGELKSIEGRGNGPIDACVHAMGQMGLHFHLEEYSQSALDAPQEDSAASALSQIKLQRRSGLQGGPVGPVVIGRGKDVDTVRANMQALFNAMNRLLKMAGPSEISGVDALRAA